MGQAPAGSSYDQALHPGEAVRIFTGGPLPMGADAIVIQEDTKADGEKITVLIREAVRRRFDDGAQHVATNPAESVDGDFDGHAMSSDG